MPSTGWATCCPGHRIADLSAAQSVQLNGAAVAGLITTNASLSVPGTLAVAGDAFLNGSFTLDGQLNISGSFHAFGPAALHGTVNVGTGQVRLEAGGEVGGAVAVGNGATVHFRQGTFTLLPGVTLTGQGLLLMGDAGAQSVITVAGNVTATRIELRDGVINGPGTLAISQQFTWMDGTLAGPGSLTIQQNAVAHLLPGHDKQIDGGALVNNGTFIWQGGQIIMPNGSISNQVQGTFLIHTVTGEATLDSINGTFFNHGVVRKELGTRDVIISARFHHMSGQVQVLTGVLTLASQSEYWAPLDVAAGAKIQLSADTTFTFKPGSSMTGNGQYSAFGLSRVVTENVLALTPTNFELAVGASVVGTGVLSPQNFVWKHGTIGAPIVINGTMTLQTPDFKKLDGGVLTNHGIITLLDGEIQFDGSPSQIINYGLFDIRADKSIVYNEDGEHHGEFLNAFNVGSGARGRIEKTLGTVDQEFNVPSYNSGHVLLRGHSITFGKDFRNQSGGQVRLGDGDMSLQGSLHNLTGALIDLEDGVLFAHNAFNNINGGSIVIGTGDLAFVHSVDFIGTTNITMAGGVLSLGAPSTLYELAVISGHGTIMGALINTGTIDIGGAGIGRITINGSSPTRTLATFSLESPAQRRISTTNWLSMARLPWPEL